MTEASALHRIAAARCDLYGLLSRLLRAPAEAADRATLSDPAVVDELAALYGRKAVAPWARALEGPSPDAAGRDALARHERQEFMDLLATPSRRFVKPWESVYRDERSIGEERVAGLLCGPSAAAVERAYREAAVQFDPKGLADLPDNAAVEMAFLEHLCETERAAADAGRGGEADEATARQRRFVAEHLARWVPALGDEIAVQAETDLYRGLGAFLRGFVAAEERLLGVAIAAGGR